MVKALRWAVIATHLALCATLLAMGVPRLWNIAAQLDSGYVPDYYGMLIAVLATPLVLTVLILSALIVWSRGSRRWLIATDVLATVASWSVLIILVFANDLPLVTLVLAPIALLLVLVAPRAGVPPETSPS